MQEIDVKVAKCRDGAVVPSYQTAGAAGFDFYATEDVIIPPGHTTLVKTGLKFEIPEGYEIQVRPRSGLSLKTKMRVANSPGTIDSDYRDEVGIIVENIAPSQYGASPAQYEATIIKVKAGDRIAQGILAEVIRARFQQTFEDLSETARKGGFGSTGA